MQPRLWLFTVLILTILPSSAALAASYCVDVFTSPIRLATGLTLEALTSLDTIKKETPLRFTQEGKSGPFRGPSKFAVYEASVENGQGDIIELVLIASARPEGSVFDSKWKLSNRVSLSTRNANGGIGEIVRLIKDSAGPFYSTSSAPLHRTHQFTAAVLLGDKSRSVLVKLTEQNLSEDPQKPIWSGTYEVSISVRD